MEQEEDPEFRGEVQYLVQLPQLVEVMVALLTFYRTHQVIHKPAVVVDQVVVQELNLVAVQRQVVQELPDHQDKVMMVVIQHIQPLVEVVVLEHKEKILVLKLVMMHLVVLVV